MTAYESHMFKRAETACIPQCSAYLRQVEAVHAAGYLTTFRINPDSVTHPQLVSIDMAAEAHCLGSAKIGALLANAV